MSKQCPHCKRFKAWRMVEEFVYQCRNCEGLIVDKDEILKTYGDKNMTGFSFDVTRGEAESFKKSKGMRLRKVKSSENYDGTGTFYVHVEFEEIKNQKPEWMDSDDVYFGILNGMTARECLVKNEGNPYTSGTLENYLWNAGWWIKDEQITKNKSRPRILRRLRI